MLLRLNCSSFSFVVSGTFKWTCRWLIFNKNKNESFDWQPLISSDISKKQKDTWKVQIESTQ